MGPPSDGLTPYVLTGVRECGREIGRGSYATVLELEYLGLKCVGKKIHDELLAQGGTSYAVTRFQEECRLLSQVRHPNVVQFIGIYYKKNTMVPILVMEFLDTNLTSCIEKHGVLPSEITHTILRDVAVGLCYLHGQNPPIIHRDLSANNVLLTSNMNAKISDLGVARILCLNPLQLSRMTQTPGTPAYMPPEVMVAHPKYDTTIDCFSFGILVIHSLSGEWPEPQIGPNRIDPVTNKLIPVSEAERREKFLKGIGQEHPLMELILKCVDNNPRSRPHVTEIMDHLRRSEKEIASPKNRLELLTQIDTIEREKRDLLVEVHLKEKEISRLQEEFSAMKLALSSQITQQRLQIDDLTCQIQGLEAQKVSHTQIMEKLRAETEDQTEQASSNKTEIKLALKSFEETMLEEKERQSEQRAEEKQRYERLLEEEKDHYDKAILNKVKLETELLSLRSTEASLRKALSCKDTVIMEKDLALELQSKTLERSNTIALELNAQLNEARKFLSTTKQVFTCAYVTTRCSL